MEIDKSVIKFVKVIGYTDYFSNFACSIPELNDFTLSDQH